MLKKREREKKVKQENKNIDILIKNKKYSIN